jgi:hypothetical protein
MMRRTAIVSGWITMAGTMCFVLVVATLQLVQPGHDWSSQLMSELALGPHGEFMFLAFLSLAVSAFAAQVGMGVLGASWGIRSMLVIVAISFLGAGAFPLGSATQLHVSLVATAFVLLALVTYMLPRSCAAFASASLRTTSWGLGGATALSAAAGNLSMPMGITQRVAAACILSWLVMVGWRLSRPGSRD